MQADTSHRVRKRRVFYIPGYDPFHPRRYRELYRKEAAAQAQISGYEIGLTPKTTGDRYGWHVDAHIENAQVSTWSQIGSIELGLLTNADWQAKWVRHPETGQTITFDVTNNTAR